MSEENMAAKEAELARPQGLKMNLQLFAEGDPAPADPGSDPVPSNDPEPVEPTPSDPVPNDPAPADPSPEDITKTQAFAHRLKEESAKIKSELQREAAAIKAENERIAAALKGYGYEGSLNEIADNLMAQQNNITPDQARALREAEEAARFEQLQKEQELVFYKSTVIENMKSQDLKTIKEAYPDVKVDRMEDLGQTFIDIFNTGKVSAVEAYEAARVIEGRSKKPTPPALGGVNGTGNTEKDFYTPAEVDRLTEADYDRDPKLWDRVRKSMLKWK